MTNHKHLSGKKVGISLAALAAAAAGTYFLYGTVAGRKKRQQVKGWMLKAKGEILEKLENAKDISEDAYNRIVSGVEKKYKGVKNVDEKELVALVRGVKKHWKNIKRAFQEGQTKTRRQRDEN